MIKGGFFSSQSANKPEQDLTDPLGKYIIKNAYINIPIILIVRFKEYRRPMG